MVIPDYELICEIMLVAEGFIEARLLARKFISLYTLCKELLSKQVHTHLLIHLLLLFVLDHCDLLNKIIVSCRIIMTGA